MSWWISRDTVVGNAFIRGVSGGERKRVSIAEMMCTRSCVASWYVIIIHVFSLSKLIHLVADRDNSTRGLDASTALGMHSYLSTVSYVVCGPYGDVI